MARRKYAREFKLSAVKLVNEQGYSPAEAAKSLGVDPNSVRAWVEKFTAEEGVAPSGEGALKAELRRLRKENAQLLMEREILKKRRHSSPGSSREIRIRAGASPALAGGCDVSCAESEPGRVLRLAQAAAVATRPASRTVAEKNPQGASGESRVVWLPARAPGAVDRRRSRQP